jgi:hypothetical protein
MWRKKRERMGRGTNKKEKNNYYRQKDMTQNLDSLANKKNQRLLM